MSQSRYLVIDLEATCDNEGAVPRHEMEIIEIGAVLVDPGTFQPVRELQTFVRPVVHPVLTPFCRTLTSITQADVDGAPTFPEAIEALRRFLEGERRVRFCSWGQYDRNQFRQDAQRHQVRLPFDDRLHINLKQVFAEKAGIRRGFGLRRALQHVGLDFDGVHHRGIDDARNIVRLMPFIYNGAAMPSPPAHTRRRRRHPRR